MPWPCLKVLTRQGGLGTSSIGETIYILETTTHVGCHIFVACRLDGLGVIFGKWGGGGPRLGGSSGVSLVEPGVVTFYVAVIRVRGALPPLKVDTFSFFNLNDLALACWPSVSKLE